MKERNQIILKLLLTHIFPLIGLLFLSFIVSKNDFLVITITQTVLIIVFFAGYWEFFGIKFKWIFCISVEIVILILLIYQLISGIAEPSYNLWFAILFLLQLFLVWVLGKIIIVIFKNDKENIEISFPFEQGLYLVTDGGNSKISRMMNYHFHSPVHKKKTQTNRCYMLLISLKSVKSTHHLFQP